jgi:hypothetical protein
MLIYLVLVAVLVLLIQNYTTLRQWTYLQVSPNIVGVSVYPLLQELDFELGEKREGKDFSNIRFSKDGSYQNSAGPFVIQHVYMSALQVAPGFSRYPLQNPKKSDMFVESWNFAREKFDLEVIFSLRADDYTLVNGMSMEDMGGATRNMLGKYYDVRFVVTEVWVYPNGRMTVYGYIDQVNLSNKR